MHSRPATKNGKQKKIISFSKFVVRNQRFLRI